MVDQNGIIDSCSNGLPHALDQKEHFWLVILKSPQMHIDIQKCAVGGDYTGVEVKRRK